MRSLKSACVLALLLSVDGGNFTEALSILPPLALDQPDDSRKWMFYFRWVWRHWAPPNILRPGAAGVGQGVLRQR